MKKDDCGTKRLTIVCDSSINANVCTMSSTIMEDTLYLLNSILLGEDPTVEDFILLVGTCVAFVAFVLWCCFPVAPKDPPVGYRRPEPAYF